MAIMTQHFNGLSEAEQERLVILSEECGEVIQAVCKILRHGYNSNNNGQMPETNRQMLERELGDLGHAVRRMEIAADINRVAIAARAASKPQRIEPYLHHQRRTNEEPRAALVELVRAEVAEEIYDGGEPKPGGGSA